MRGYVAEAVTITFGILAALGLDAAWDYRSDRVDEAGYTRGLYAEFGEALAEIQADQDARSRMRASASRILEARRRGETLPFDTIAAALPDLIDYRFYTPSQPVLGELLSVGRLGVMRSGPLRFGLRQYIQERDRLEVVEQRDLDLAADMSRYLAERVSLDLLASDDPAALSAEQRRRVVDLLHDDRFGSLVYLRWSNLETTLTFASGVIFNIRRALGHLEEQGGVPER